MLKGGFLRLRLSSRLGISDFGVVDTLGVSLDEPILASMPGVVPALVDRFSGSLSLFDGGSVKDAGNAGKASDEVLKRLGTDDVRGVELGWAEKGSKLIE